VTDESGGAIGGATVTLRDARGSVLRTVSSGADGAFEVSTPEPGQYVVQGAADLFEAAREEVSVRADRPAGVVRLVLRIAGLVQSLVVTGTRVETRQAESPKKIEVVDRTDIERSAAVDLTDVLKKNSGVDVIQYPGVLSGVGIRGFRPEFSGINKRSLLLINGRPAGSTNLGTILLGSVDRIEVLKGPASSVYGASAMGGVINIITRQSRGPIAGRVTGSLGSFATSEFSGNVGGSLSSRVDFDAAANMFDQHEDFRMGDGAVRPATTFKTYDGSARLGADVGGAWRLDGRINMYRGRDILTPGDVFDGVNNQGKKNLERTTGDVGLSGQLGRHMLSTTVFASEEQSHTNRITSTNVLDRPYLPFLSFESQIGWLGAQVRDSWGWFRANNVVYGLDYERIESETRSYARTGARQAPFSANNRKTTYGVYAENTLRLRNGATVVSMGGRVDAITIDALDTPFKTGFTTSGTTFTIFNPSAGVKQQLAPSLRAHATIGRAFVPADAAALTGYTETIVGGRPQITQGNPDLRPERSLSYDAGLEWSGRSTFLDATYFQTKVTDRVIGSVVISNPPPPDPVRVSYVNALGARIKGMDVDLNQRLGSHLTAFSNITHYFSRREELPATGERNILNVATNTVRAGIDVDAGRFSGRFAARYVQGRQDNDFNVAGTPVIDYPDFVVAEANVRYRVRDRHSLSLVVNNVFDKLYFEKKGFPLAGRAVALKYLFDLGRSSQRP
jgi:vitamin B12 transporter